MLSVVIETFIDVTNFFSARKIFFSIFLHFLAEFPQNFHRLEFLDFHIAISRDYFEIFFTKSAKIFIQKCPEATRDFSFPTVPTKIPITTEVM